MKSFLKKIFSKTNFNSADYWESRYSVGGNSGDGSYGRLAAFKADFLNSFIQEHKINTVIEFGCGDGHQLSLINYPSYLGLDVSETIIQLCRKKFENDSSKSFMVYDINSVFNNGSGKADLCLSLDVIYHIVEEAPFQKYMRDLFSSSSEYVIIYSTNFDRTETTHVLHRNFLTFVKNNFSSFTLLNEIINPYPGNAEGESEANFYIFKKLR
jgi:SAM-dependent methyltransferase